MWLFRLVFSILCALPLIPLARLDSSYTVDWTNHTWLIAYFGAYFREHGWFPVVLNTNQTIGMAYPVFYGFFFYPVAGIISILTGANVALRLICAGMLVWQTLEVWKTARLILANRWLAVAFAAIVSFAIYPMTNLYNRGAITEFIAAAVLIVLTCNWLRFVLQRGRYGATPFLIGFALAFSFILGTHPITAVLGAIALGVLALLTFRLGAEPLPIRSVVASAAAGLILVAPFLYAYARFGSKLAMSGVSGILVYAQSLDNVWIRFSPWPRDHRVEHQPLPTISSPYLDTQLNVPLLLLCVFLLVLAVRAFRTLQPRERKWLTAGLASFGGFAVVAGVSVTELVLLPLEKYVQFMQFAYRLVTYCDMFLFITAILLMVALRGVLLHQQRLFAGCLAVCLAISTTGVVMKLGHAHVVEAHDIPAGARLGAPPAAVAELPLNFYGSGMYAVTAGIPEAQASMGVYPATLPVGLGTPFDQPTPVQMRAPAGFVLKTNVQPFPWNRILVNGSEVPLKRYLRVNDTVALPASASLDQISYQVHPDSAWLVLRAMSFLTAFGIAVWLLAVRWGYSTVRTPCRALPPQLS